MKTSCVVCLFSSEILTLKTIHAPLACALQMIPDAIREITMSARIGIQDALEIIAGSFQILIKCLCASYVYVLILIADSLTTSERKFVPACSACRMQRHITRVRVLLAGRR